MSEGLGHDDGRPWRPAMGMQQRPQDPKETERLKAELEAQAARERELAERLRKKKDGETGKKG